MSLIIKNATVICSASSYHKKQADIYIEKGIIVAIGKKLKVTAKQTIAGKDLFVSPTWVDVMADYCDPGFEHKETISSGLAAAANGGFGDVIITPNTQPAIATKSVVEYISQQAKGNKVKLHISGAVTKNIEGAELAEILDMHHSGAIAFGDGWHPIQNAQLMLKALEYVKIFNGLIIQIPENASLAKGGLMNEGINSVSLGMPGIPTIAETIQVYRDLELLKYTDSRLHFTGVSTAASLKLIKEAKKQKLNVTCSVTPYHLLFSDDALKEYDSNYKLNPPLRSESDRKAVIKALEDGTIDCIATHHRPHERDAKAKEFEYAEGGMNTQETTYAMLVAAAPHINAERWVELLCDNPKKIFNLPENKIEKGAIAQLTVFSPTEKWNFDKKTKKSKGINSPLLGKEITGKAFIV